MNLYLRDTLRFPGKGASPLSTPLLDQPAGHGPPCKDIVVLTTSGPARVTRDFEKALSPLAKS